VISKRLEAYSLLETQIALLKSSVLDNDGKPFHIIFSYGSDEYQEFMKNAILANAHNLWLNSETNESLSDLIGIYNQIRFEFEIDKPMDLIKAGKKYYEKIVVIRDRLEELVRKDILSLYKLKAIQKKKTETKYVQVHLRKENKS